MNTFKVTFYEGSPAHSRAYYLVEYNEIGVEINREICGYGKQGLRYAKQEWRKKTKKVKSKS